MSRKWSLVLWGVGYNQDVNVLGVQLFFPPVSPVLWLTLAAKELLHCSSFVTQIFTYTHLQLRFVRDNFMLEKGRITLQPYLLSVQLLDSLARIPFTLCLWFSLSVRNRTCIVLSAENQILAWYISFSLPTSAPPSQCSKYGSTLKLSALQKIQLQHIAGIQFINC